MITDTIGRLSRYKGIPELKELAEYIEANDLNSLPEAHDRYIDLQYMLEGEEYIGYAEREALGDPVESREEDDVCFFEGKTCKLLIKSGSFGIFFPEDIHEPCIAAGESRQVKKAVFKIRCRM